MVALLSKSVVVATLVVFSILTCFGTSLAMQTFQEPIEKNPVEIGSVNWTRDLDAAFANSQRSGKPVLLLFQEVPGCEGCQTFGREVLSHPLLVEAIENEFLPVVVFNNRADGPDKALLERFGEPAWNYQVIRFLDGEGKDIIPREDGVWSIEGVAARMMAVLKKSNRPIPKFLLTIPGSIISSNHEQAAFAMHCFWTGEYQLGAIEGVVNTEAGWLDGREVTRVTFDSSIISLAELAKQAAKIECADKIYTRDGIEYEGLRSGTLDETYRAAEASDQKKQLSQWSEILKLPGLNSMQITKLNSLMPRDRTAALEWLSPKQRSEFDRSPAGK